MCPNHCCKGDRESHALPHWGGRRRVPWKSNAPLQHDAAKVQAGGWEGGGGNKSHHSAEGGGESEEVISVGAISAATPHLIRQWNCRWVGEKEKAGRSGNFYCHPHPSARDRQPREQKWMGGDKETASVIVGKAANGNSRVLLQPGIPPLHWFLVAFCFCHNVAVEWFFSPLWSIQAVYILYAANVLLP